MINLNQPQSTLLTPKHVAQQLGIDFKTLQKWRCTGLYSLPYVKVGGRVMYRQGDIDAFIEARIRVHT